MSADLRFVRTFALGRGERGFVLIVAMLLLMVLSLVVIAGAQGTIIEEHMAGNNNARMNAFQAAEAGLRDGEARIQAMKNTLVFQQNQPGFYPATAFPAALDPSQWGSGSSIAGPAIQLPNGVTITPRYYIKILKDQSLGAHQIHDYGGSGPATHAALFSVTARALTPRGAQVVLRSYYKKEF